MGIASKLFFISILVAILAVLIVVFSNEEYQKPIESKLKSFQKSDGWKQIRRTWTRASEKTRLFVKKVEDGKLSQEIGDFIDDTCRTLLGVGLDDLPTHLKQLEGTWGGTTLLVIWLGIGLIVYTYFTSGYALSLMALLLLLHAFYGQTWCLYQAVIFVGLLLYFLSLIANNAVIAAATICLFYLMCSVCYLCGRGQSSNSDILEKVDHVHYRTTMVEQRLRKMDRKLDKILKKKDVASTEDED